MRDILAGRRGIGGPVASAVGQATATPQGRVEPIRNIPSPDQNVGNYPTRTSTFITEAGAAAAIVYQASTAWSKVKLRLETAGPVAVSTTQQFLPVTSGKGILLPPGEWVELELAQGNNLYIASTTVNRVIVVVQPISWAEQILGGIVRGVDVLARALAPMASVPGSIQTLAGSINSMLQAAGMKLRR
jgi:hypothetical protein